jgi:DNA modification methylase
MPKSRKSNGHPGRQVEMRPLASLIPYARNPRTHSDAQVAQIAASIREFGWTNPILVDGENGIIAGHGRLLAARKLGMTEVPVIELKGLTKAQQRAYLIVDNKLALDAGWNEELLRLELADLKALDFDLGLTGFDETELAGLLAEGTQGLTDPDDVPEPPETPVVQPGDLWVMGKHRLLCGDSGRRGDVDRLLDGSMVQLCNSDPPYNVNVEPRSNNAIAAGRKAAARRTTKKLRAKDRPLANDCVTEESYGALLRAWFSNIARVLEPGRAFYLWGGYANYANYPPALKESKLYFSQIIVWVKQHPVLARKDFMTDHESCFYGWREGAAHVYLGPTNATDVWTVKKVNPASMVHLTEKPVELAARAIQYSTRAGENVLDLFAGSGSTLIAAEQLNRSAFLMEIDPLYCDVIITRWQEFTGREAVLDGDGRTFKQVKARRLKK